MLSCLNWQLIESCANVDEGFEVFYNFLFAVINDRIPIVSLKNRKFPTWYDHDLISIVKDKEQAWKDYKLSKSADKPELYKKYTDLRRSLKSCQKMKYLDYITLMQESISTNPKRFWDFCQLY